MRIHRPVYIGQLYAYAYFVPMYACKKKSAHRHTLKNPNLENKNTEIE